MLCRSSIARQELRSWRHSFTAPQNKLETELSLKRFHLFYIPLSVNMYLARLLPRKKLEELSDSKRFISNHKYDTESG